MRCSAFITECLVVAGLVAAAGSPTAQEYETSSSPYQGDYAYTIGQDLSPNVEIDGVRWRGLRIAPKSDRELPSGKAVKTEIVFDFENTNTGDATLTVVILFEDAQGNSLDRIECDPERVPDGESREFLQKYKIQGDVLRSTENLYLFCEVEL